MIHALTIMAFAFRLRRARRLLVAGHIGEARRVIAALDREHRIA